MAKKSMTPSERREAILRVLCQRRQDKIDNLAEEFGVSVRTIKNDIEELTLAHPIETVRGRYGGGVKVADGYYVGRNYLKPKQWKQRKFLICRVHIIRMITVPIFCGITPIRSTGKICIPKCLLQGWLRWKTAMTASTAIQIGKTRWMIFRISW